MKRFWIAPRHRVLCLWSVAALFALPSGLRAQKVCASHEKLPSVIEIRIDVAAQAESRTLACGMKVSESNDVRVVLMNFNGIRYKPTLTVEGTAVESYQALLGLWEQIIGLAGADSSALGARSRSSVTEWSLALRVMRDGLRKSRERAGGSISLDSAMAREISAGAEALVKLIPALDSKRGEAELALADEGGSSQVPLFLYYAGLHDALVPAIREHAMLASRSAEGWIEPVRSFDAGTQVSVGVAIAPREGSNVVQRREYSIRYLVESKLPVVFHAGFGFTDFSGVKYEKISTVSSGDAFKELAAPQSDLGLSAFLTYLFPFSSGDVRFGASLGTDVDEAKKSLHVGLTVLYAQRFALTGGWTARNEEEGVNAIGDGLYETITGLRRDRWFVAFSIAPGR